VQFYLPKTALKDPARLEWKAVTATSAARPACDARVASTRSFTILTSRAPTIILFQEISKRLPVEDDLAVAVTDNPHRRYP